MPPVVGRNENKRGCCILITWFLAGIKEKKEIVS
jgi:hypothetical protein